MAETLYFTVPQDCDGMTAKWFLKSRCGLSTRMITRLKREKDGILMDGKILRTVDTVVAGASILISLPKEDFSFVEPREGTLDIVYEDSHLLVVNKPPFMFRTHNRLDRNTSGLVLMTKDKYSVNLLKNKVHKTYFALVHGSLSGEGTVNAPIGLRDDSKIVRCVRADGSPAVTHYQSIFYTDSCSLLRLWLETGRTHQIRCHMSAMGHPLLGDDLYGGSMELISRQALHCGTMRFLHPVTGEELVLETPMPEDMNRIIQKKKPDR